MRKTMIDSALADANFPLRVLCTKIRKILIADVELRRSSQIVAQGCSTLGSVASPKYSTPKELANSYRVHLGVLSLSQGWKSWAEIGKRLWRSTFCAKPT